MKKKAIWLIPALLLVLIIAYVVISNGQKDSTVVISNGQKDSTEHDVFYRWGQIIKKEIGAAKGEDANKDVVISAKDFSVNASDLENLTEENELTCNDYAEAKALALDQLIVKRSLYYYALDNGYGVDEAAIQKSIDDTREGLKTAENKSDYDKFIEGLGMTEDEYWESQYDLVKLDEVVAGFIKNKQTEFVNNTEITDTDELVKKSTEYIMDIIEKAVNKQKIVLSDDVDWTFSRSDQYIIDLCR